MKSITQVVENLIKPYIDSHDRTAEAIIAPVETDATSASDDYAVGKQLILNNVLYDVIAPITAGDALVVNTNIKEADNISSDIEALTNKLNNEIVTRSELGAKNLLPYDIQKIKALNTAGTWNGNTYTPNNSSLNITLNTDGSITVDGTSASAATATLYIYGSASEANENIFKGMIASGCPSGGATNKYSLAIQGFSTTTPSGGNNYHDIGEGITVGNDNYVRVYVRIQNNTTVSNLTFKPMIRLASDPDATYQPYAKTNQELTAENQTLTNDISDINTALGNEVATRAKVSGHNFVPFPYYTNSIEIAGITWTTYSDGRVKANGTATALSIFDAINTELHSPFSLEQGDYVLTDGLSASDYEMAYSAVTLMYSDGTVEYNHADTSIGKNDFAMPAKSSIKQFYLGLCIKSGETVNDLIFYPMIRLASDKDTTYQPYSMTNQELTPIAQAVSNRNLLDNPWFTVNQRGQSSYTTSGAYTVDRWKLYGSASSVTINSDDSLSLAYSSNFQFQHRVSPDLSKALNGKVVTLSCLYQDGTIKSGTFTWKHDEETNEIIISHAGFDWNFRNILPDGDSGHIIRIIRSSGSSETTISIKAVKLELGSVSTLAQDIAPNYQQELAKCQRYFQRVKTSNAGSPYGFGFTFSPTDHRITIPSIKGLRTNPSITGDVSKWVIRTADGAHQGTPTAVSLTNFDTDNGVMLAFTTNDFGSTTSEMVLATCGYADGYLDFSADL